MVIPRFLLGAATAALSGGMSRNSVRAAALCRAA